jgi:hypothetical protein
VTVLFAPAAAQGLARLPLLPAVTAGSSAEDRLLPEAVFLASRQAGAAIRSPDRGGGRFAAVLRAYEIRARRRPTPHGAFAGVAPVRFAPGPASLHLGDGHTARTYPTAMVLQILHATTDPDDRLLAAASAAAGIARAVADADLATLTGRAVTRESRRRLTALRPQARAAGPAAIRGANAAALTGLYDALAAYRAVLPEARRPACASTLIHMHANRLLGDTADEPLARALAADLLAPR